MRLRCSSRNFLAPLWLRIRLWRTPSAYQLVTTEYVLVLSGTSFSFPPKFGAQVNAMKCTRQQLDGECVAAIFIVLAAGLRAVFCINERRTGRSNHARLGSARALLDDTELILFHIGGGCPHRQTARPMRIGGQRMRNSSTAKPNIRWSCSRRARSLAAERIR